MESMCGSEIQEYEGSKDEQIKQKGVSIHYWDGMLYSMCKMDERVDFSGKMQVRWIWNTTHVAKIWLVYDDDDKLSIDKTNQAKGILVN
jgi:hypothetical protein